MTDKRINQESDRSNMEKKSGRLGHWGGADDRSAEVLSETAVRRSREPFDENLTEAEASKRIEEL